MALSCAVSRREGCRWPRRSSAGLWAASLLVALGCPTNASAAEVSVQVTGAQVDLDAVAAPVGEVLDRLAGQTGMKVVYDGPKPRNLITLKLRGRSPAETVLAVLEGLGVNFALVAEAGGKRIQTLMVSVSATGTALVKPEPVRAHPPTPPPSFLARGDDSFGDDSAGAPEEPAALSSTPEPPAAAVGSDGMATPPPATTDGGASAAPSPKPSPASPFSFQPFPPVTMSTPRPLTFPTPTPAVSPPATQPPSGNPSGVTPPDPGQNPTP